MIFNKNKIIELAKQEEREKIYNEIRQEELRKEQANLNIKFFELESKLGQLVICVSNEISNPTVGLAKDIIYITQANIPTLVVYDIVKKEDILPLGTIFIFTEQKFNALNNMEPNERISILYNKDDPHTVDKSSTKKSEPLPSDEWKKIVYQAIDELNSSKKSKLSKKM